MAPIVLTKFGEMLNPYSGADKHGTTDGTALHASCWGERVYDKDMVGVHDICGGIIRLKKVSKTHNAICCDHCNLRIVIPIEIDNYEKLRTFCEKEIWREDENEKTLGFAYVQRGQDKRIATGQF